MAHEHNCSVGKVNTNWFTNIEGKKKKGNIAVKGRSGVTNGAYFILQKNTSCVSKCVSKVTPVKIRPHFTLSYPKCTN